MKNLKNLVFVVFGVLTGMAVQSAWATDPSDKEHVCDCPPPPPCAVQEVQIEAVKFLREQAKVAQENK